ncbi:hypothetical protein BaRGS_00018827, partial [Batillaria attramentaria]
MVRASLAPLLLLAVCVASVAGVEEEPDVPLGSSSDSSEGPTIEDVTNLVNRPSVCYRGKYPGLFSLKNRQQDALADLFQAQVKELQHRTDAAQAHIDGVIQQASDTSAALHDLQQQLNTETSTNHAQDSQINHLTGELNHCKQQILEDLESNMDELCEQVNTTEEKASTEQCLCAPVNWGNVTFKTLFDVTPDVSLSLTGFSGHLDGHSYDADCLAFNSTAVDVTTEGFSVELEDESGGDVTLKHLTYRFMACQNLNEELPVCPAGFPLEFGSSCYSVGEQALPFDEAKSFCEEQGGMLAEIGSSPENEFLKALALQNPVTGCASEIDLVFVLDESGSVGDENFEMVKTFVQDVISSLDIETNMIRVGVVTYSSSAAVDFFLNTHSTESAVNLAVSNIVYSGGGTDTAEALELLPSDVFTEANGDRPDVPNVAVIITDGNSGTDVTGPAQNARDAGIKLLAVGVGSGIDLSELNLIASDPDSENVFQVDDFNVLNDTLKNLWTTICSITGYWFGASDETTEGTFQRLSDGEDIDFTDWKLGQPNGGVNENCAEIRFAEDFDGQWNDRDCEENNLFFCEFTNRSLLNTQTIVQINTNDLSNNNSVCGVATMEE